MRVYLGQTRSRELCARLTELGFGEMTARGELFPRREPWAYDNGAFGDWKARRSFDAAAFRTDMRRLHEADVPPDFIVCPDIVAGGLESLDFSLAWTEEIRGDIPLYLAVQDGMRPADVNDYMDEFAGIFVGGTLAWKLQEGETWTGYAHALRIPCHIGRVGTPRRVQWAKRIHADSIDSCLPLWSTPQLLRFVEALSDSAQAELWAARPPEAP